ncbi:MAG: hypothetical protein HYU67_05470 [Flavobacteriia bacterium]|nr:hypothetical protein [Flavobacteriia bacterium]
MKKLFVTLTLAMFVGTLAVPVFASTSNTSIEIKKEEKKRKKKNKKGGCCASKEGAAKSCGSHEKAGAEKKSCGHHSETK